MVEALDSVLNVNVSLSQIFSSPAEKPRTKKPRFLFPSQKERDVSLRRTIFTLQKETRRPPGTMEIQIRQLCLCTSLQTL